MPLSTVIFPSSLNIKAQDRGIGKVFSRDPANARFYAHSYLTGKDTETQRRRVRCPMTSLCLTETLAPVHVPVFGGCDRGEVRTLHTPKDKSILLVGLIISLLKNLILFIHVFIFFIEV